MTRVDPFCWRLWHRSSGHCGFVAVSKSDDGLVTRTETVWRCAKCAKRVRRAY